MLMTALLTALVAFQAEPVTLTSAQRAYGRDETVAVRLHNRSRERVVLERFEVVRLSIPRNTLGASEALREHALRLGLTSVVASKPLDDSVAPGSSKTFRWKPERPGAVEGVYVAVARLRDGRALRAEFSMLDATLELESARIAPGEPLRMTFTNHSKRRLAAKPWLVIDVFGRTHRGLMWGGGRQLDLPTGDHVGIDFRFATEPPPGLYRLSVLVGYEDGSAWAELSRWVMIRPKKSTPRGPAAPRRRLLEAAPE